MITVTEKKDFDKQYLTMVSVRTKLRQSSWKNARHPLQNNGRKTQIQNL